jgi:RNA polymerase sigma-70 factor (ECF subfamily)
VEALAPRQRTLLRYAYVDGLGIDRIAPLFAVHRATAARWLAEARLELLRHTRKILAARLALPVEELQSLLRSVESQLHVSLARLFATENSR